MDATQFEAIDEYICRHFAPADPVLDAALRAAESLRGMQIRQEAPFDLVFIDADKGGYLEYLRSAMNLTRPGSVIAADNVVRGGGILDPDSPDESVQGVRAFNAALAAEPRLEAVILQQVGAKGHDGLALARVTAEPLSTAPSPTPRT